MTGRLRCIAALVAICVAPAACRPPAAADAGAVRPLPTQAPQLPDLSSLEPATQQQLRDAWDLLKRLVGDQTAKPNEVAAAYGRLGTLLMAAEYYKSAEPFLVNACAIQPDELRWSYYLAHVYRARNETAPAAHWFERSTRGDPNYQPAWAWLGDMDLDLGRLDDAERSFRQLQALNPRGAAGPFGLGRTALAQGHHAAAIEYLSSALALDEHSAGIRYSLAMAYRAAGDQARAEEYLRGSGPRGALRLEDPLMQDIDGLLHSSQAYRATAVWTFNRGDRTTSVEYFQKASALATDEPSLQYEVGVGLFLAGDAPSAILRFNNALRLSPAFAKAHYGLGIALARQGDTTQALQHLSAAVKASPDYLEAELGLADLLRRLGRFADALPPYERVIDLDPRIPEAWLGYALSLGGAGRQTTARAILREGASRFPDHPEFSDAFKQLFGANDSH